MKPSTAPILASTLLLALCAASPAGAQSVIPYSGYLETAGTPVSGEVQMRFRLFDGDPARVLNSARRFYAAEK